jgi:hypothetical protein
MASFGDISAAEMTALGRVLPEAPAEFLRNVSADKATGAGVGG